MSITHCDLGAAKERAGEVARKENQVEHALLVRIVLVIEILGKKVVEIGSFYWKSLLLWASLHHHDTTPIPTQA